MTKKEFRLGLIVALAGNSAVTREEMSDEHCAKVITSLANRITEKMEKDAGDDEAFDNANAADKFTAEFCKFSKELLRLTDRIRDEINTVSFTLYNQ